MNHEIHPTRLSSHKQRFDERYSHPLSPFNRPLQRRILAKIYYGECDTAYWGKGFTRCECVLVNDVPVFVLYDDHKRELVTVIPPEDWRIAKYLRWRRWTLRQKIALANPQDKQLGRRITNTHVFQNLAASAHLGR